MFHLLQFTSFAQEGWFWQDSLPQARGLTDVWVFDENKLIAVDWWTIIKTTDAGENWTITPLNTTGNLHSVYFIDNNIGWIAGDHETILKTLDRGDSWSILNNNINADYYCTSIFFSNSDTGWSIWNAFGSSETHIKKTTNGGENWFIQYSSQADIHHYICMVPFLS